LEEADETVFWLELCQEGNIFPSEELRDLVREANELVAIFVSSVRTARGLPLQSDL
jgi:four helix bundle protein